jgi:hypothetical protein
MAASVLDIDYLSAYLSIPQQTLDTLVDAPTVDLVQVVLSAVANKAREHDELVADKLRLDIELENAVRGAETRIQNLRANLEKTERTVEEVRIKLKDEGNHTRSLSVLSQTNNLSHRGHQVASRNRTSSHQVFVLKFYIRGRKAPHSHIYFGSCQPRHRSCAGVKDNRK